MNGEDLPRPAGDVADDGVPATEEVRDETLHTGDTGVADTPMPDRPWGTDAWGTTEREQQAKEPLEAKLAREEPERRSDTTDRHRVLEPGAEGGIADTEPDTVGEADTAHYDTLSPEEDAVHVREDPGGLNTDRHPGYVDDEDR